VRTHPSRARKFLRRVARLLGVRRYRRLAQPVSLSPFTAVQPGFSSAPLRRLSVIHRRPRALPTTARSEVDTFYTYPEWYIVWSYQSKADFQSNHLPSSYSYFGDIGQFWQAYCCVYAATRAIYPFPTGDHIMLAVIGSSFTLEYALKGLYEETVGRLSEGQAIISQWLRMTYAAQVAESYAAFVHIRPFYEFSFAHALRGFVGQHAVPRHSSCSHHRTPSVAYSRLLG
jgi:hypothetical protein